MSEVPLPDFAAGVPVDAFASQPGVAGLWGDESVVVVKKTDGYCAVSGKCTHAGGPLGDGLLVDDEIRCPWHHARFALETGEAIGPPAFAPLSCFEVEEVDSMVRITGKCKPIDFSEDADPALGRIIIIGGGAAGHACAEWLVRYGQGAAVTLISEEHDAPYDRTACSKGYLSGELDRNQIALPLNHHHLAEAVVTLKTLVTGIDLDGEVVCTEKNGAIGYDTVILATGCEAVRPDLPGLDRDNVFVLRTLLDADRIIAATVNARRAVVIGSSFIGLEAAAALRARGLQVDIVSIEAVPLSGALGVEAGCYVKALHERNGVTFHQERYFKSFDGESVEFEDGTRIDADLVVLGLGVRLRVELAQQMGLEMMPEAQGGGVKVDGKFRTSVPNIYAIGDIACLPDARLGASYRLEHWVHAQRQGQALARMLLGQQQEAFGDAPFFWTTHYDATVTCVGLKGPNDVATVEGDVGQGSFIITFREQDGQANGQITAKVAVNRDLDQLKTEARWDR